MVTLLANLVWHEFNHHSNQCSKSIERRRITCTVSPTHSSCKPLPCSLRLILRWESMELANPGTWCDWLCLCIYTRLACPYLAHPPPGRCGHIGALHTDSNAAGDLLRHTERALEDTLSGCYYIRSNCNSYSHKPTHVRRSTKHSHSHSRS